MTKRTGEEFLQDFTELKTSMKIGKKMFRDAYDEEVKELKKMEKILKLGLKGKEPVTEDYLALGLLTINRQLQRMNDTQHMLTHVILGNIEKTMEGVLTVNGIIEIIGDLTRDSKLKSVQTKVKKLQKFQKHIIDQVKQNQKSKPNLTQAYSGVM
jgi:hypothetical protein